MFGFLYLSNPEYTGLSYWNLPGAANSPDDQSGLRTVG